MMGSIIYWHVCRKTCSNFFPKITEPAICVTRHRSQQVQARRWGGTQRVDPMDFPRFYQLELGTRCSVHVKDGWYESWLRSASQGNILKDYVCISESRVCGLWLCPDMVILLQYGNYGNYDGHHGEHDGNTWNIPSGYVKIAIENHHF